METQAEFRAAFNEEVGDLSTLTSDAEIDRWVNEGRTRLGIYDHKTATLTWSDGDTEVDLPTDFVKFGRVRGDETYKLRAYDVWGKKLLILDDDGATADGTATLLYLAHYPEITDVQNSTMPAEANRGCLSYALYRFFRKLSSNRLVYKRYSTTVGANAVQIEDLQDEAARHYDDFLAAQDEIPLEEPSFFFGAGD